MSFGLNYVYLFCRRSDPSRRRQVKRDKATQPKKGVAGLRIGNIDPNCDNNTNNTTDDETDVAAGTNTNDLRASVRDTADSINDVRATFNSINDVRATADTVHDVRATADSSDDLTGLTASSLAIRPSQENLHSDSRGSITSQIRSVSDQLRSVVNDLINLELEEDEVNDDDEEDSDEEHLLV